MLILLAIGIKAAFPGLHVWLKDGYAEAAPTGPFGYVPLPQNVQSVCWRDCSRSGNSHNRWRSHGNVSIFYAVIENDLRRVLCYSKINQIGFMVVGIGVGTELAIDGAVPMPLPCSLQGFAVHNYGCGPF